MKLIQLVSLAVASIVLAACNQASPTTDEANESPAAESINQGNTAMEEAEVTTAPTRKEVPMTNSATMKIDMFSFGYSVDEINTSPGETITVNLTNSGGMHDFVVDELGVKSDVINEGETTSVTFTIPEDTARGTTYAFYCSVGNHRAQGMEGTLIVE